MDHSKKATGYTPELGQRWIRYMRLAAAHSRNNASHWFRYLRKDIEQKDVTFSQNEIDFLLNDKEYLTAFQRVSLQRAFTDGTVTRLRIQQLNQQHKYKSLDERWEQFEQFRKTGRL